MGKREKLQDLTIKNNFLFGAVMCEEENCKGFLEMTLGFPIEQVEVSKEKSIVYHPEYKGIRLDVYAKDENNTHYNVEMQVLKRAALGKRSRYYHSQIDMELLLKGKEYQDLPDTYVIFICDFDPFGKKRYCYTFMNCCLEDKELKLRDGSISIFLSTKGENETEVSQELMNFLKFVSADLKESISDFQDPYVKQLQEAISRIKSNREMEERYMILTELLKDEYSEGMLLGREEGMLLGREEGMLLGREEGMLLGREEGKVEGKAEDILDFLGDLGEVPDTLRDEIMLQRDITILQRWLKLAAKAESIIQFQEKM